MTTLELFIMPPAGGLILILLGLLLWRRRLGRLAIWLGLGVLYVASLPAVSYALIHGLEARSGAVPLSEAAASDAQAIVILAGGRRPNALEYGGEDTVNRYSLKRARYGAWVHRETGLPILVSGGRVGGDEPLSEAELIVSLLENEFGVPVRWVEDESRNTCENALYSAQRLAEEGVTHALLVTQALHIPRARWCFEKTDLQITAVPTFDRQPDPDESFDLRGFIPQANAMSRTRFALHEYLGLLWYRYFKYR
ncbi:MULTISPECIES: YdcF family protein [Ectothiorhodospira]|uniref:YdcF family protein n=1 Tax=Ectothiorhodospira TaxID=1051 RepID=UPI001EE7B9C0|nr:MULTISPECIES: YdcF family protein [Ectothiorhodospira]MCG5494651.1 YdcF family protein [Ectothiorhodospira variabilis]MCG5503642.1 YdcF family protein [Ectothiorhodospira variabilis]MCG5506643.1 YdcF family protein [Ectothiorhodospira variabilis]MCG5523620.1 YdcF family protein [Ectothiorhodospira haloalkaliphila]